MTPHVYEPDKNLKTGDGTARTPTMLAAIYEKTV